MPERNSSSDNHRFGFNGQEKDDEISGNGNSYAAEFWQYDPRLGRRWNIDPVVKQFESPFATFSNNPIIFIDPNGKDTLPANPEGIGMVDMKPINIEAKKEKSFLPKVLGWIDNKLSSIFGIYSVNGEFGDENKSPKFRITVSPQLMDMFDLLVGKLFGEKPIKSNAEAKQQRNDDLTTKRNNEKRGENYSGSDEIYENRGPESQNSNKPQLKKETAAPIVDSIYEIVHEPDQSYNLLIIRKDKIPVDTFHYAPSPPK